MKEELAKLWEEYKGSKESRYYCPECGYDAMCASAKLITPTSFQDFMEWVSQVR